MLFRRKDCTTKFCPLLSVLSFALPGAALAALIAGANVHFDPEQIKANALAQKSNFASLSFDQICSQKLNDKPVEFSTDVKIGENTEIVTGTVSIKSSICSGDKPTMAIVVKQGGKAYDLTLKSHPNMSEAISVIDKLKAAPTAEKPAAPRMAYNNTPALSN